MLLSVAYVVCGGFVLAVASYCLAILSRRWSSDLREVVSPVTFCGVVLVAFSLFL